MTRILVLSVIAAVALSGVTMTATLARADLVELKTGQRVEGTFKQLSLSGVEIEVGGQTITFELAKVRALYFGAAPSATPATATPSAGQEALRALRDLRSATASGVTMRDYISRTADTKVKVDRYLQEPEQGDQAAREAVRAAMKYYSATGRLWSARVGLVGRSPSQSAIMSAATHMAQFSDCNRPGLKDKMVQWATTGEGTALQEMWACASERVTEAEKLIGNQ